jgi:dihydrofolate reductase
VAVVLDITTSLDGYVAAPGDDVERLHRWIFEGADTDPVVRGGDTYGPHDIIREAFESAGAVVMGRRTFGDEPGGRWGDAPPFEMPCFVVTHQTRDPLVVGATTFTFVDGVDAAVAQARAAAGAKDVHLMGGAAVAQQALRAGLVDEVQLHVASVLLGDGLRLFDGVGGIELEPLRISETPGATHLRYRVAG